MRTTILTFQFAHNYGALLQAYALKKFVSLNGNETTIAPYYPEWAQAEYAIIPFAKNIPPRRRIRLAMQYSKRRKLSSIFESFIREELAVKDTFDNHEALQAWINENDYVICGSDQIWNNLITKDDPSYFAVGSGAKKIAYAASTGTTALNETQKKFITRYLPDFKAISVREPDSAKQIEQILDKKIQVVMDPVFLLPGSEWDLLASPIDISGPYMFLYFLQENEGLLNYAKEYAKENGLIIYDVHPTMAKHHEGCKRLDLVGPKEFLWLIKYAECVCTNSFHATSFSTIYRKKLLHIPNSKSPERTISLLKRAGFDLIPSGNLPFYELNCSNRDGLNKEIETSKQFLLSSLGKE